MKNIQHLDLDNNSLGGTLPAIDAGNRSLDLLSLAYNELTGCRPNLLLQRQPACTGGSCDRA
jgi:hypothetical protein